MLHPNALLPPQCWNVVRINLRDLVPLSDIWSSFHYRAVLRMVRSYKIFLSSSGQTKSAVYEDDDDFWCALSTTFTLAHAVCCSQLNGAIPRELASLHFLLELRVRENRLSGKIPPMLGNLRSLQVHALHGRSKCVALDRRPLPKKINKQKLWTLMVWRASPGQ